jgi:membrane protein implicated in regulation of membrane protease activity
MLGTFFGLIGVLAVAAIPMMREWPLTLAVSAFVLAEIASIWLLLAYFRRVIAEIRKRNSH